MRILVNNDIRKGFQMVRHWLPLEHKMNGMLQGADRRGNQLKGIVKGSGGMLPNRMAVEQRQANDRAMFDGLLDKNFEDKNVIGTLKHILRLFGENNYSFDLPLAETSQYIIRIMQEKPAAQEAAANINLILGDLRKESLACKKLISTGNKDAARLIVEGMKTRALGEALLLEHELNKVRESGQQPAVAGSLEARAEEIELRTGEYALGDPNSPPPPPPPAAEPSDPFATSGIQGLARAVGEKAAAGQLPVGEKPPTDTSINRAYAADEAKMAGKAGMAPLPEQPAPPAMSGTGAARAAFANLFEAKAQETIDRVLNEAPELTYMDKKYLIVELAEIARSYDDLAADAYRAIRNLMRS